MNKQPSRLGPRAFLSKQLIRVAGRLIGVPSAGGPLARKDAPFYWPAQYQGTVQWTQGNFMNYTREGFELNSVIYAAMMYKVRAATQARLRAYEGEVDNPTALDLKHPLSMLLVRPNSFQSFQEFHSQIIIYLNLSGNSYIFLDRKGAVSGVPNSMYTLRPDRVYIIPDEKNSIKGFLYRPEGYAIKDGVPMLPEDLIHIKFPHPLDPYEGMGYGLSPLAPMARSADVDNQVTRFLKILFDRGALPIGILKYDIPLDDDAVGEIKVRWRERYGGVDNWSDVGVMDNGASYEKLSQSFEEMGFDAVDERNESRILGPLGVPPILIGTRFGLQRSTYSNYKEARTAFWEDTMSYELNLQESEYEHYLAPEDGTFVRWDTGEVPALKRDITAQIDAGYKLWTMGVPSATAFKAVGLTIEESDGSDIAFVTTAVKPLEQALEPPQPPPAFGAPQVDENGKPIPPKPAAADEEAEPDADENQQPATSEELAGEDGKFWPPPVKYETPEEVQHKRFLAYSPERKLLREVRMDRLARDHEDAYSSGANEVFHDQLTYIKAQIKAAEVKALITKASVAWDPVRMDILQYLKTEGQENWRTTFVPLISGTMTDAGNLWKRELGVSFDVRNFEAEAWFQKYTLEFAQNVTQTTSDDIQAVMNQGLEEGWSIGEMQNHMTDVFTQYMSGDLSPEDFQWFKDRMPAYRTEMIARTETMRASNNRSLNHYKNWGVTEKEWSATMDSRTRPDHMSANGQVVKIDELFNVGGWDMDCPGDASHGAPPKEFVFCRCSILPTGEIDANPVAAEGAAQQYTPEELKAMPMKERLAALDERYKDRRDGIQALGKKYKAEYDQKKADLNTRRTEVRQEMSRLEREFFNAKTSEEKAKAGQALIDYEKVVNKWEADWKALPNSYREYARSKSDMLDIFSFGPDAKLKITADTQYTMATRSKETADWYNKVLNGDKFSLGDRFYVEKMNGRAYYDSGTAFLTNRDGVPTYVHEIGHGLEDHHASILDQSKAFLKARIGEGETPKKLSVLTGYSGYDDREIAYKDDFKNPYTGKLYGRSIGSANATEVVSMGFENLYERPIQFAEEDPEFFNYILSVAEGIW